MLASCNDKNERFVTASSVYLSFVALRQRKLAIINTDSNKKTM
jgi:hypothetical protein